MASSARTPTDAELARYLARDCSIADMHRIDDWLSEGTENTARLEAVRMIWDAPGTAAPANMDALWSRVRARTTRTLPRVVPSSPVIKPRRLHDSALNARFLGSIAAIVVVAISLSLVMEREQLQTAVREPDKPREYSTGRGEHATVQLQDGTRVTLAPLSRVRILQGFGRSSRELELTGEAVLDVTHDVERPFRVHAGSAVAEDIGTRFDIRAYAGEPVMVAVAEGAVSLGRQPDSSAARTRKPEGVLVQAGAVARLDERGQVTTRQVADRAAYFGWADGTLAFDAMPMGDVCRTLERWFDVTIRLGDAALERSVLTARFGHQPIRVIVASLADSVGATATWQGTTVTLAPRR